MWMLHLFAPLLFALIYLRTIRPMRCGTGLKTAISIFAAFGCFKLEISRIFGGPMMFAPAFPGWLVIIMTWAYAVTFLLLPLILIADLTKGIYWSAATIAKHKPDAESFRTLTNRINLVLLIAALLAATCGIISGTSDPTVKRLDVAIKNLPQNADGTTLALMSDLHADGLTDKKRLSAMVEISNNLHPDAVLITGDFVDGPVATRAEQISVLTNLTSTFGTFAVPGNHDYYSGFTPWQHKFSEFNVNMLVNRHVVLSNGLVIAGVADVAAGRMGEDEPDIEKALANSPSGNAAVLLAHNPVYAVTASQYDIGIQLSGHTHGGIGPGFNCIVAACNKGYVRGLYNVHDMLLYVSPGTGIWNGFPIRIFNPAEITLITLHKKGE